MTAPTDFVDVPSGALCGAIVTLTCKGPDEERSYFLEYDSQLDPDDYIVSVTAAAGDTALAIADITVLGRRFRFTITGGTLNQTSGIEFTMALKSGDIRTLVCVVSIEAQGVLQSGTVPVVMGSQGARGTQIWFSDTDPTSTFTPPNSVAVNSGDIVYSQASNAFWTASYVDSVLTWAQSVVLLEAVVAEAAASKLVTDFFSVVDDRLCIDKSKLSATPAQAGELYLSSGALMVYTG